MIKKGFTASIAAASAFLALALAGCTETAKTNDTAKASDNAVASTDNGNAGQPAAATNANASPATTAPTVAPPTGVNTSRGASAAGTPNPTAPDDPRTPKPQIGSGASDFSLFTQARGALNSDNELKGSGVILDIREGVATLTGTVSNEQQKQKAAQLVQSVPGIKSVKNQLRISAGVEKR